MKRWEYLLSEEYEIRKVIAWHYLKNCDVCIDIGAYGKPIPYIKNIHSIDPLATMSDSFHGTIGQWIEEFLPKLSGTVGVALLGFDIEGDGEYEKLLNFLKNVDVIVLECALEFEPSVQKTNDLLKNINHKVESVINIELPPIQEEGYPPFSKRKMYILKRG